MKFPNKNTTQGPNHQQKLQKQGQDDQDPQHQLSQTDLTAQQIQKSISVIAKLEKISKTKITALKKKNEPLNKLFGLMSSFFVTDRAKNKERVKKQKVKRLQDRKKGMLQKLKDIQVHIPKQKLLQMGQQISKQESNPQIVQLRQGQGQQQQQPQYLQQLSHQKKKHRICYICSKSFTETDDFYHKHCPPCAAFSKIKRYQTADLRGKIALVTGARIKIGYEITLRLLRDGSTVYATTRFTKDAFLRYQKQPDYLSFKDRLFLIQCDFLSSAQVMFLISYIKQNIKHLDILIHNAAQTLTRPTQFYTFQLQNQQKQLQYDQKHMITFESKSYPSLQFNKDKAIQASQTTHIDLKHTDQFGQPLDLRPKNTWKEKIQEVSLEDCLSTQIINSTVPFYITGQLRSIMGGQTPSFIVNVSSMQGVFYRQAKTYFHPHTNMAKASLNMITRTCAYQFAHHNIFMNSVDTGWVTNQNPFTTIVKMKVKHDFDPPLDCIQGAMRVIDPIYQGITHRKFIYGKFLKNYQQSFW